MRSTQRNADILQTVRRFGPATLRVIVERSGYDETVVRTGLAPMVAAGTVQRRRLGSKGMAGGTRGFVYWCAT